MEQGIHSAPGMVLGAGLSTRLRPGWGCAQGPLLTPEAKPILSSQFAPRNRSLINKQLGPSRKGGCFLSCHQDCAGRFTASREGHRLHCLCATGSLYVWAHGQTHRGSKHHSWARLCPCGMRLPMTAVSPSAGPGTRPRSFTNHFSLLIPFLFPEGCAFLVFCTLLSHFLLVRNATGPEPDAS